MRFTTQLMMALSLMAGALFTGSFAYAETQQVQVYDQSPGQTGQWWCDNHFGKNLGGYWRCDSVRGGRHYGTSCNSDAPYGSIVTCTKYSNGGGGYPHDPIQSDYQRMETYGGPVQSRTGQWWCQNHFGNNLGGYWRCVSVDGFRNSCHQGYLQDGTTVTCERQ